MANLQTQKSRLRQKVGKLGFQQPVLKNYSQPGRGDGRGATIPRSAPGQRLRLGLGVAATCALAAGGESIGRG
jgi:hypothetical protein